MGIDVSSLIVEVGEGEQTPSPTVGDPAIPLDNKDIMNIPRWHFFGSDSVSVDRVGGMLVELVIVTTISKRTSGNQWLINMISVFMPSVTRLRADSDMFCSLRHVFCAEELFSWQIISNGIISIRLIILEWHYIN
jgi:hypothetical protein